MTVTYEFRRMVEECIRSFPAAGVLAGLLSRPTMASGVTYPNPTLSGRILENQGSNVTCANNLTLPGDGNSFVVLTGVNQINLIDTTGWIPGSAFLLVFSIGVTIKHNFTATSTFQSIWLSNRVDFVAAANSALRLRWLNSLWWEEGRLI